MNSKWSYIACGVNGVIALFGALGHSLSLLLIGGIFAFWNWNCGEYNRSKEDESIRKETKSEPDTKTEE